MYSFHACEEAGRCRPERPPVYPRAVTEFFSCFHGMPNLDNLKVLSVLQQGNDNTIGIKDNDLVLWQCDTFVLAYESHT